jgi:HEAT repeat protein
MDVCRPNLTEAEQEVLKKDAPEQRPQSAHLRSFHLVAMIAGIVIAVLVSIAGGPIALSGKAAGVLSPQRNSHTSDPFSEPDLDSQRPQKQAEMLLERAVSRSNGAADETGAQIEAQVEAQIEARVEGWRGQLKWDSQLGDLTTVALNSSDRSVRTSAIEVQLAAYGLTKSESSVDGLVRQANSRDHTQKIWALWALGLLGNRGIQADRIVQVLAAHLKDSGKVSNGNQPKNNHEEDARRWAVEGLALVGTTATIAPLLEALHDDPSAMVRERAACSLAKSGMLSPQQRLTAVPQLIAFSADPALDNQTHSLAFQALAGITKQRLPNDPAAWRTWYQTSQARTQ